MSILGVWRPFFLKKNGGGGGESSGKLNRKRGVLFWRGRHTQDTWFIREKEFGILQYQTPMSPRRFVLNRINTINKPEMKV